MKKRVKQFLVMLLAGALFASCLSACGQTKGQQSSEQSSEQTSQKQSEQSSQSEASKEPVSTEPITISILTSRHSDGTTDIEEIWYFRYLEYWLAQQGYNVTLDVQQTMETEQQISLMLGTNTLPDLIWGIGLDPNQAVVYGEGEGIILDWTPYINEETMPNLYRELQAEPDALIANTCTNGEVYSIPYIGTGRIYGDGSLTFGSVDRMYVNTTWLEKCDLEMPTDIDGFLDMLRAFKDEIKLDNGDKVIPLLSNASFFEKFLWICSGYYGSGLGKYGTEISIKDGKITYPAYSEDYRTFIEIMKTCYDEGLISPDYFTMDSTTMRGFSKTGVNGVTCDYTLANVPVYGEWAEISPFAIGDTDKVAVSLSANYAVGTTWASAETEHPEILAMIVDHLYSPEGAAYYYYGPMEGQDPLNKVDGFYLKDKADFSTQTTKMVENGKVESFTAYLRNYIRPLDSVGRPSLGEGYCLDLLGMKKELTAYSVTDAITGKEIAGTVKNVYTSETVGGHWRIVSSEAMEDYVTTISLPSVYLNEEDALYVAEAKVLLESHITSESAKFITGTRPLSEIDTFFKELKTMGIEDYIAVFEDAYKIYMDSVFE